MRRPEENIRQSSALNFKSVMEERKTRISSLVGTKGRWESNFLKGSCVGSQGLCRT